MHVTLYRRSYPVADAPVALSLAPHQPGQRHTYTAAGRVYEAEHREVRVVAPGDAKLDPLTNLLCWAGEAGTVRSTAREVFDLAEAHRSGFRLAE